MNALPTTPGKFAPGDPAPWLCARALGHSPSTSSWPPTVASCRVFLRAPGTPELTLPYDEIDCCRRAVALHRHFRT